MPRLHEIIEQHWQRPKPWLTLLLAPLSRLFAHATAKRRQAFLNGKRAVFRLPVPVVVVGNIHAGGTGKTPIVAALVDALRARGIRVGIISRGHGRKMRGVHVLTPQSTAEQAGDEPLLLYRKTQAPTAVGSDRFAAGTALIQAHPEIELVVADDGLQHYALHRDLEIAVFPAADVQRTDLDLLPNGGLREPISRLAACDAVVISGGTASDSIDLPCPNLFFSRLSTQPIYRLNRPEEHLDIGCLKNRHVAALAAIAKPQRFFDTLTHLGIALNSTHTLPDHAALTASALPQADIVIITEKDAVKLPRNTATENVWVLPVCAIMMPDLAALVCRTLEKQYG